MKVLLDNCVSGQAVEPIRNAGNDVIWAGDWPEDPGDELIFRTAVAESRVVVTIDKDFGELAIVQRIVHVGLIRLIGFRAAAQGSCGAIACNLFYRVGGGCDPDCRAMARANTTPLAAISSPSATLPV